MQSQTPQEALIFADHIFLERQIEKVVIFFDSMGY